MLVLLDFRMGGFICGASAISKQWAISASHCLEFNNPPSQINLRGGSTNRMSGGFVFLVESYMLHPQYDPFMLDYDVSLIKVQSYTPIEGINVKPIPISPVCSSSCCHTCEENDVTISGWG